VIAEGWALTDDEVSPASRTRLAELKARSLFSVSCGCAQCEAGPLAGILRGKRLIKAGHATDRGSELEQNERFVVVSD